MPEREMEDERYEITVWDMTGGDILAKVWDGTEADIADIEARFQDHPFAEIQIEPKF